MKALRKVNMIQVDLKSRVPIYEQLIESIKVGIISGQLEADERLPSVRELATSLLVNPNTIQKAIRRLEHEGFVYTVPGKGNYVMRLNAALIREEKEKLIDEINSLALRAYKLGMTKDELYKEIVNCKEEVTDAPGY